MSTFTRRALPLALVLAVVTLGAGPCPTDPDRLRGNATVRFLQVEGGCWAIDVDQGDRFEPTNLPQAFREDGLRVFVVLERRHDLGSYCMIGPIADVVRIEQR